MSRADQARAYFREGYACAQAVALAFADLADVDTDALERILLPFGGGIARQRLTCGAVSGMVAAAGAIYAEGGVSRENKKQVYEIVRLLCARFVQQRGTLICGELLARAGVDSAAGGVPEARTEEYYKKRPCDEIVYVAAQVLEQYLTENPPRKAE